MTPRARLAIDANAPLLDLGLERFHGLTVRRCLHAVRRHAYWFRWVLRRGAGAKKAPAKGRGFLGTPGSAGQCGYSTVTLLARLRGWSTSKPLAEASSAAKICSGTVVSSGISSVGVSGT